MSEDKFNPWVSMWREPRQTIQTIAEHHPKRSLWLLAWVYGFTSLLNGFQSVPIALQVGLLPMFLLAVIIAPFWGYAAMSIWSYIIVLVGKVFKGKANFHTARAAYAWSCVPLLGNIPIWLILVFIYPMNFLGMQGNIQVPTPLMILLFLILVAKLILSVWSLVIYLIALAQVQGFSVMCAIGNSILAGIVIGVVLWVIWMLGSMMGSHGMGFISWSIQ